MGGCVVDLLCCLFPYGLLNEMTERIYGIVYCVLGTICLIVFIKPYFSVIGIIIGAILIFSGLVLIFDKSRTREPQQREHQQRQTRLRHVNKEHRSFWYLWIEKNGNIKKKLYEKYLLKLNFF